MPRSRSPQPTEVELQILRILWDRGVSPVSEIHAQLKLLKDVNYSTTVKMLAVMLQKGLIRRDESAQPHLYRPVLTRKKAGRQMLSYLIDRVYEGSALGLVLQALSHAPASPEDLQEIRRVLDEMEGEST